MFYMLTGAHTAIHTDEFGKMLDDWQLTSKVHVVVRDNVDDMARGTEVAGIPSVGCFAHSMQLCIQPQLTSKKDDMKHIVQLLAQCRSLGDHFSHSVLAKEKFRRVQESMQGIPHHQLTQDVATRWNSTYYMVDRIVEQEEAITSYERHYRGELPVAVPSSFKFGWLRQLVHLLRPVEEATREICRHSATAADVIPVIMAVKLKLQTDDGEDMRPVRDNILSQIGECLALLFIFTALHGMQSRYSDGNSVCLSVCLSVRQMRAL